MDPQGLTDTARVRISIYINKENNKHMSRLVVVGYDDPYKAEEVRLKLRKLHSEYLLDLEDVVVAVKLTDWCSLTLPFSSLTATTTSSRSSRYSLCSFCSIR